jgi:hypothetical protein
MNDTIFAGHDQRTCLLPARLLAHFRVPTTSGPDGVLGEHRRGALQYRGGTFGARLAQYGNAPEAGLSRGRRTRSASSA